MTTGARRGITATSAILQRARMRRLSVPLSHAPYDILFAPAFSSGEPGEDLRQLAGGRHCLIITDSIVAPLYAARCEALLNSAGAAKVATVSFPAGEQNKTLETLAALYAGGIEHGIDRGSLVIALGGGVVGDTAGFFAATFMRGVDYLQIPTTLLAQVDSSVGGKTAVDLPQGKNLVGAFYQPKLVLVDVESLASLPPRQLRCGLAEVVKYGCIMDAGFFAFLEARVEGLLGLDSGLYEEVTCRCCELKAQVVLEDERETTGRRAILNYGHTFGHALEMLAGYSALTHGEAIAIGMGMAVDLAILRGATAELETMRERQDALFAALGLPIRATGGNYSPEQVLTAMRTDKKYAQGKSRLILPSRMGEVKLVKDVPDDEVLSAIGGRCD